MKFWLTSLGVLLLDQFSKYWIMTNFSLGESRVLINHILNLTYVNNPGAAFGILAGKSWFFLICAALVVIIFSLYNHRFSPPGLVQFIMGLMVGGALGNFIDRWRFNAVVDFLDLGWWPVFNFADTAIVCGGLLLMLYLLFNNRSEEI